MTVRRRTRRAMGCVATLLAVGFGVAGCVPEGGGPPAVGDAAPTFAAMTLDGREVTLESLRGDVVLLNLWATWCAPCREETPYLQEIYEEHRGEGFEVVGISMDTGDAADDVAMFVEEYDVSYTILHDGTMQPMDTYHVLGLPATFLLDREGVLRWVRYGPIAEGDPNFLAALEDVIS